MATVTTKDGTPIYYKDWDEEQVLVFSHGWALTVDAWDARRPCTADADRINASLLAFIQA